MSQPSRPARGRRVVDIDAAVIGTSPVQPDPTDHLDEPGRLEAELLVFPGELLTTSTTLATILPGDEKESYFGAKHTAIVQPDEAFEAVRNRSLTVVNNTVLTTIDDCIIQIKELEDLQRQRDEADLGPRA